MTTSFTTPTQSAGPGTAAAVAIAVIASVAVFGLFVAGITFAALAIAFPMVGPIADQVTFIYPFASISASDLALAERFADAWWVFGVLAVGSLAGAGVVAVKAIQHLSPVARD
jgi:hypothetical protein